MATIQSLEASIASNSALIAELMVKLGRYNPLSAEERSKIEQEVDDLIDMNNELQDQIQDIHEEEIRNQMIADANKMRDACKELEKKLEDSSEEEKANIQTRIDELMEKIESIMQDIGRYEEYEEYNEYDDYDDGHDHLAEANGYCSY